MFPFRYDHRNTIELSRTLYPPHPDRIKPGGGGGGGVSFVVRDIPQWTRSMSLNRHNFLCCLECLKGFGGCVTSPRPISIGQLHTLLCFHVRPINPVVYRGPYQLKRCGSPHLEACFPLRCFQRLSLPNVANQPCSWWNNWHTRG